LNRSAKLNLYSNGLRYPYLSETYVPSTINYPGKWDHLGTSYYPRTYVPSYIYDKYAYLDRVYSLDSSYYRAYLDTKYYTPSSYYYSKYDYYPYTTYSDYLNSRLDAKVAAARLDTKIELARLDTKIELAKLDASLNYKYYDSLYPITSRYYYPS